MTRRADERKDATPPKDAAEKDASAAGTSDAFATGNLPTLPPVPAERLAHKLACGKLLSVSELEGLREAAESAGPQESAATQKFGAPKAVTTNCDASGAEAAAGSSAEGATLGEAEHEKTALRRENEALRREVATLERLARAHRGATDINEIDWIEENRALRSHLLATEEQCTRLVAALNASESALIDRQLQQRLAVAP